MDRNLLVWVALLISACKPFEQKIAEEFLIKTVHQSWDIKVPYHDLYKAKGICTKNPDYEGCNLVDMQIYDISLSYSTCLYDQRSQLCKIIIDEVRKTLLYLELPKTNPLELPSTPFYFELPTKLLKEKSTNYGYREETKAWLWSEIKIYVQIAFLTILIVLSYFCFHICKKKIQQNKEKQKAIQIALQLEHEEVEREKEQNELKKMQNELKEKQAKLEQEKRVQEEEKKAKDERQKLIAEQQRILLEAKIAQEKQQKIDQERAEIRKFFNKAEKGKS